MFTDTALSYVDELDMLHKSSSWHVALHCRLSLYGESATVNYIAARRQTRRHMSMCMHAECVDVGRHTQGLRKPRKV